MRHVDPIELARWRVASALVLACACAPEPDRHVWGEGWVPPADSIGGIDPSESDASTGEPEIGSDGPVDPSAPPSDEGVHDEGGLDDHGEESGPPALEESDGGGPAASPYVGGWDIGDCQDAIVSTGTQVGGVAPQVVLSDQFGDQVNLYDFCHKAVFLTAGAFW